MFWGGGQLIDYYSEKNDSGKIIKMNIKPDDIFGALFCIMFAGF